MPVSTHSRLKAAGFDDIDFAQVQISVSTHSRLKAAGHGRLKNQAVRQVSTHSRLKAAGGGGKTD